MKTYTKILLVLLGISFVCGIVYFTYTNTQKNLLGASNNIYQNGGNVGISTTTPFRKLGVNGSINAQITGGGGVTIGEWPDAAGYSIVSLSNDASDVAGILCGVNAGDSDCYYSSGPGGTLHILAGGGIYNNTATYDFSATGALTIPTSIAVNGTLDSGYKGKIGGYLESNGIATMLSCTGPGAGYYSFSFCFNGEVTVGEFVTGSGGAFVRYSPDKTNFLYMGADNTSGTVDYQFKDSFSSKKLLTIRNSNAASCVGNFCHVGVSSTTPWGMFSVNPDQTAGPLFVIGSSTATNFIVSNAGKVGIGTTSPVSTFNVVGTASSTITIGGSTSKSCETWYSVPSGNPFRKYIDDTGAFVTEAGQCSGN